jgi:hypothetical protein
VRSNPWDNGTQISVCDQVHRGGAWKLCCGPGAEAKIGANTEMKHIERRKLIPFFFYCVEKLWMISCWSSTFATSSQFSSAPELWAASPLHRSEACGTSAAYDK